MPSPAADQAALDARRVGRALIKFISPNDVGMTGGHQKGYYLPKAIWKAFTPHPPKKGVNSDHRVEAIWPDGRVTRSTVKWYGRGTRSEYRLTGFNRERDFPFISSDCVGSLLVLIPQRLDRFLIYVLSLEDEIEDLQAALGVEAVRGWALFEPGVTSEVEGENECIERHFHTFAVQLRGFPPTLQFAIEARAALEACVTRYGGLTADAQLLRCVEAEYELFRLVERRLCEPDTVRDFASIDDFLLTAQTILQRRKARAGRSLEHHVEYQLRRAEIPFEPRVEVEGTRPDILIPGRREYLDSRYPDAKLFAIGIKTTCKDRWRQVLREAPRVRTKHILTMQKGISPAQLEEMRVSEVTLVVPQGLHTDYPPERRADLLSVAAFVDRIRSALGLP